MHSSGTSNRGNLHIPIIAVRMTYSSKLLKYGRSDCDALAQDETWIRLNDFLNSLQDCLCLFPPVDVSHEPDVNREVHRVIGSKNSWIGCSRKGLAGE
jgi:hypothetical protein